MSALSSSPDTARLSPLNVERLIPFGSPRVSRPHDALSTGALGPDGALRGGRPQPMVAGAGQRHELPRDGTHARPVTRSSAGMISYRARIRTGSRIAVSTMPPAIGLLRETASTPGRRRPRVREPVAGGSNIARQADLALFMVDALENDDLVHEAPATASRPIGCS